MGPIRARAALLASGMLALAICSCLVFAGRSDAHAGGKPCGSYIENGGFVEFTGDQNKRISVTNQHVDCDAAITVIREFRSYLPKRHHGAAGDLGSWTLPADPGWTCRKEESGGFCNRGHAVAVFRVGVLAGRARCGDLAPDGAGAIFISWRHVGCGLRRRIAKALFDGDRHRHVEGFGCHNLGLRAGGGGALCRRGSRFVEVGFE
jgi:hypothetical protein